MNCPFCPSWEYELMLCIEMIWAHLQFFLFLRVDIKHVIESVCMMNTLFVLCCRVTSGISQVKSEHLECLPEVLALHRCSRSWLANYISRWWLVTVGVFEELHAWWACLLIWFFNCLNRLPEQFLKTPRTKLRCIWSMLMLHTTTFF